MSRELALTEEIDACLRHIFSKSPSTACGGQLLTIAAVRYVHFDYPCVNPTISFVRAGT